MAKCVVLKVDVVFHHPLINTTRQELLLNGKKVQYNDGRKTAL